MKENKLAEQLRATPATKLWLALMLAWTAGFVDVLGYLVLLNTFTSHMSGNSVAMVASLASHHWKEAARHAIPIPAFVLGVFLAALLGIIATRKRMRRRLSIGMVFEAGMLGAFALYLRPILHAQTSIPEWRFWVGSIFLAIAMGVQSAALRQVWGKPVHTAFITGMLTHLGENTAELFFNKEREPGTLQFVLLNAGICSAFALGAGCGGLSELRWGLTALIAPIGLLLLVAVFDTIWPVHHGQ